MSDAERDPVVRRAIDELRRLPEVDRAVMQRVVQAAAAARLTPADDDVVPPRAAPRTRWLVSGGMLAAAAVIGFLASDVWRARAVEKKPNVAATTIAVRPAANDSRELLPIPQRFVFSSPGAHKVAVVGDFNGWNSAAAPMARSPNGTVWSATVPVLPGRHGYGFMIDDSLFVLDPSAPKSRDTDLGSDISVIIVGRP